MTILERKIDTRSGHFNGSAIGMWFDSLMKEAHEKGHDGCKLTWWDPCEGWASCSASFADAEEFPTETWVSE